MFALVVKQHLQAATFDQESARGIGEYSGRAYVNSTTRSISETCFPPILLYEPRWKDVRLVEKG